MSAGQPGLLRTLHDSSGDRPHLNMVYLRETLYLGFGGQQHQYGRYPELDDVRHGNSSTFSAGLSGEVAENPIAWSAADGRRECVVGIRRTATADPTGGSRVCFLHTSVKAPLLNCGCPCCGFYYQ